MYGITDKKTFVDKAFNFIEIKTTLKIIASYDFKSKEIYF